MKKCLPIYKLQCFVRVARLKKMRDALKNHDEKTSIFHENSIRYPVKKMSQTKYAVKIAQNTSTRALCRSMG